MLTPLQLFTCTLSAKFENYQNDIIKLGELLEPKEDVLAINSNYIHKAQPDHEKHLKSPKESKKSKKININRRQGDGTCFRSCIEFIIKIKNPNIPSHKVYRPRLYPVSGELQIPGIIKSDFSDGYIILDVLSKFLNQKTPETITPILANYKCTITFNNSDELLDTRKMHKYISTSEETDLPYPLLETHHADSGSQALMIRFKINEKIQCVAIWGSGKINIIGVKHKLDVDKIYEYLNQIIPNFIVVKPPLDNDNI